MLTLLRQYIFKKRIEPFLANNKRERVFINYARAKTILLLFESHFSEKNPETKRIIESLTNDGKKVVAVGYVEKKALISPIYPEFIIFNQHSTDFFRKPKSIEISEVLSHEYDLLIDITQHECIPLMYVSLYANAKCKAGMKKFIYNLNDFSVDIQQYLTENQITADELPHTFLFDQIIFYLNNIQTTDY